VIAWVMDMKGSFGFTDRQRKSPEDFSRGLGGGDGCDGLRHGGDAGLRMGVGTAGGAKPCTAATRCTRSGVA
jgi:hypothetical protein